MRPNPYILRPHDDYRGRIELAADVTIAVHEYRDDEDYGTGFYAWANREDSEHWNRSHTVASAWGNTKIGALDSIAKQLGVFDRLKGDGAAAGAVNLAEGVAA